MTSSTGSRSGSQSHCAARLNFESLDRQFGICLTLLGRKGAFGLQKPSGSFESVGGFWQGIPRSYRQPKQGRLRRDCESASTIILSRL
jgi:hypothetical protein